MPFNIFLFCLKGYFETLRKNKTLKSNKNKNILWIKIKIKNKIVAFVGSINSTTTVEKSYSPTNLIKINRHL